MRQLALRLLKQYKIFTQSRRGRKKEQKKNYAKKEMKKIVRPIAEFY